MNAQKLQIKISKQASKTLSKAPLHVRDKLDAWIESLLEYGLEATRLCAGFHDEPLKGKRQGQRSIRLNRQWRVIYSEEASILCIQILEVTPHDYR